VAKLNSLNKECLDLGFEEGFGRLLRLNSPSEAFKVKGQEMSSTANMLAASGVDLTAQILHGQKEVSE
jgi:hypothetical protein